MSFNTTKNGNGYESNQPGRAGWKTSAGYAFALLALTFTAVADPPDEIAAVQDFETIQAGDSHNGWMFDSRRVFAQEIVEFEGNHFLYGNIDATTFSVATKGDGSNSWVNSNYREEGVVRVGMSTAVSARNIAAMRMITVSLWNDAGTPFDTTDDFGFFYDRNDQMIAMDGTVQSFGWDIPSQVVREIPQGWEALLAPAAMEMAPESMWDTVIQNVDRIEFNYFDPRLRYPIDVFEVAIDDIHLTVDRSIRDEPFVRSLDDELSLIEGAGRDLDSGTEAAGETWVRDAGSGSFEIDERNLGTTDPPGPDLNDGDVAKKDRLQTGERARALQTDRPTRTLQQDQSVIISGDDDLSSWKESADEVEGKASSSDEVQIDDSGLGSGDVSKKDRLGTGDRARSLQTEDPTRMLQNGGTVIINDDGVNNGDAFGEVDFEPGPGNLGVGDADGQTTIDSGDLDSAKEPADNVEGKASSSGQVQIDDSGLGSGNVNKKDRLDTADRNRPIQTDHPSRDLQNSSSAHEAEGKASSSDEVQIGDSGLGSGDVNKKDRLDTGDRARSLHNGGTVIITGDDDLSSSKEPADEVEGKASSSDEVQIDDSGLGSGDVAKKDRLQTGERARALQTDRPTRTLQQDQPVIISGDDDLSSWKEPADEVEGKASSSDEVQIGDSGLGSGDVSKKDRLDTGDRARSLQTEDPTRMLQNGGIVIINGDDDLSSWKESADEVEGKASSSDEVQIDDSGLGSGDVSKKDRLGTGDRARSLQTEDPTRMLQNGGTVIINDDGVNNGDAFGEVDFEPGPGNLGVGDADGQTTIDSGDLDSAKEPADNVEGKARSTSEIEDMGPSLGGGDVHDNGNLGNQDGAFEADAELIDAFVTLPEDPDSPNRGDAFSDVDAHGADMHLPLPDVDDLGTHSDAADQVDGFIVDAFLHLADDSKNLHQSLGQIRIEMEREEILPIDDVLKAGDAAREVSNQIRRMREQAPFFYVSPLAGGNGEKSLGSGDIYWETGGDDTHDDGGLGHGDVYREAGGEDTHDNGGLSHDDVYWETGGDDTHDNGGLDSSDAAMDEALEAAAASAAALESLLNVSQDRSLSDGELEEALNLAAGLVMETDKVFRMIRVGDPFREAGQ